MSEWDGILREEWYSREEPEEIVVEFSELLKKQKARQRVLDLACGAGRHQVFLAEHGFEAHGADISRTGLALTSQRLKKRRLYAHLVKCDMKSLPYTACCIDAVVCLHAIYHQRLEDIQVTVAEIHRVLVKNGMVLVNFLSKRTYSSGKGVEVEDGTFMEETGPEKGVLHHFTDKTEIESLFESFRIINLSLSEKEVEGRLRSRWILTAST